MTKFHAGTLIPKILSSGFFEVNMKQEIQWIYLIAIKCLQIKEII